MTTAVQHIPREGQAIGMTTWHSNPERPERKYQCCIMVQSKIEDSQHASPGFMHRF